MSLLLIPAILLAAFVLPLAMARLEPDQDPTHRAQRGKVLRRR